MVSESGVPPSPESLVVRLTASHYSTFQPSLHTRYPTALRPARSTDRDYSPHGPDRQKRPGPCLSLGSPTRSFAFSSVQPATTCESGVYQPRLVAPALHPRHAPLKGHTQRRADTNARLTIGHLTWPIALSDRTGLPPIGLSMVIRVPMVAKRKITIMYG